MRRTLVNTIASAALAAVAMTASNAIAGCEDDDEEAEYVAAYSIPVRPPIPAAGRRPRSESIVAEKPSSPARSENASARPAGASPARECKRYFPGTGETLPVPCE